MDLYKRKQAIWVQKMVWIDDRQVRFKKEINYKLIDEDGMEIELKLQECFNTKKYCPESYIA